MFSPTRERPAVSGGPERGGALHVNGSGAGPPRTNFIDQNVTAAEARAPEQSGKREGVGFGVGSEFKNVVFTRIQKKTTLEIIIAEDL